MEYGPELCSENGVLCPWCVYRCGGEEETLLEGVGGEYCLMPGAGDGDGKEEIEWGYGEEDGFEELKGREYIICGCHVGTWRGWTRERHRTC